MKPHSITSLVLLGTAAQAAVLSSRSTEAPSFNWHASHFSVASTNGSPTSYQLQLRGEGESVECIAANTVKSKACPHANGPAAFAQQSCGEDTDTFFSWEFVNSTSPLQGGGKAFFIKFTYHKPGDKKLVGCSPQFLAKDHTCTERGETLNVPAKFVASPANNGECIFV